MESSFKPIDSLQMMSYIIKSCQKKNIYINVTKLQKLLYCCYGTVLAKYGYRLTDEYPEAWPYGPVFPGTLQSIKYFGIETFAKTETPDADNAPEGVRKLIADTLDCFGGCTARQLTNWSHAKGSPWAQASKDGTLLYRRLSNDDIRTYFLNKVFK